MAVGARVAIGLNYYAPYVSGLTNSARWIAEGLARRGWAVTVVAAHHSPELARREIQQGVRIERVPVVVTLGKGVISPGLPWVCAREMRRAGLGSLHLPMLEAGVVARLLHGSTPLVATYHCDVTLRHGPLGRAIEQAMDLASRSALRAAERVTVSSEEYWAASRVHTDRGAGLTEIPPPSLRRPRGRPAYREGRGPHIGFLGRIVEEKGVPHLVRAFRGVAGPDGRLLLGGDFASVAGGSTIDEVRRAAQDDPRVRVLGFIPEDRLADFYASLDVFAFPSVNPLEAFGIAQVEAMLAGVPVVASDLPGVRQPVLRTGFGCLVPPRDAAALGDALTGILSQPAGTWAGCTERAAALFDLETILDRWELTLTRARERVDGPV